MPFPSKPKRFLRGLLAYLLPAGVAVAALASVPPAPPKAHTPLEERGRHVLQIAGGCGCHGANFAGWRQGGPDLFPRAAPFGERFVGPFGVVPASNITPDPATGIRWSEAEWEKALVAGITPSGERLSTLMPSHAYHGMARSDLHALIAYLQHCLPPVNNAVPEKEETQAAMIPLAPETAPTERPTEPVALGRYLVHHVSACTDCHSSGATANGTGEETLDGKTLHLGRESVAAPNLTPANKTGIGKWSRAAIARYLRTGTRPDGGLAQSVMAGLILTSYSKLTPEESDAIAAYLKTLAPTGSH